MATTLIITNGPGKWDIMLALFDNSNQQRLINFMTHPKSNSGLKVMVYSVARNGKNEWTINGVDAETYDDVTIEYSSQTRKGKVTMAEPSHVCPVCNETIPVSEHHEHAEDFDEDLAVAIESYRPGGHTARDRMVDETMSGGYDPTDLFSK